MTNYLAPRIYRWIKNDGLESALARAKRSMIFYRRIYLKDIELSDKDKASILVSYLELKEFLRTQEINYEPKESETYKRVVKGDGDTKDTSSLQETEEQSKESLQGDTE